jgi:hypothetical protein
MLLFSLIDTCSLLSAQLQTLFAIKPKKELLFYFSNDSFEIEKLFLMAVVYVLNTSYLQSCKRMHWMNVFVLKFFFSKLGHLGFQLLLKQTCCHCKKKKRKKIALIFYVDMDISLILNSDTSTRIQKRQSLLTRSILCRNFFLTVIVKITPSVFRHSVKNFNFNTVKNLCCI